MRYGATNYEHLAALKAKYDAPAGIVPSLPAAPWLKRSVS